MADSKSDLEDIDGNIKDVLMEVIENFLGTPDFHVGLQPGSKKGENFVGVVYRIVFSRKDADGMRKPNGQQHKKQDSNLFLKISPTNEHHRKQMSARACFLCEIYVYNEIFPCFREFQKSKGILIDEDGFHEYPTCYRTIDTELIESVFLEDLGEQMFRMVNFHAEDVTVPHIKLVMQVLGKFHATSLALKDQQPEKFQSLISNLDEIFFQRQKADFALYINCLPRTLFDAITDDKDAPLLLYLVRLFERDQLEMCLECIDPIQAEPYAVINHGDLWANNVLYQYTPELTQAYFVDFQIARYASPVCDIMHFIFTTTSKQMRDQHYDDFLKTYHESLSFQLHRLGSDPEKIFPYHAFLEQLRKFGKYGLFISSFFMQVIERDHLASADDIAKNISEGNISKIFSKSEKARERLRDICADMVRLKYI